MFTAFSVDPWKLTETELPKDHMRLSESLCSIGNGYMGMRGNFEETYSGDSHRGTYLAGVWFPDKTRVGWWKNGYPQYFGKVINAMNLISLRVVVGGHEIDLARDEVTAFERTLDMKRGVLTREYTVRLPEGEVSVAVERFVSVDTRELLCVRMAVTPSFEAAVHLIPALDARVRNEDSNYDETFWDFTGQGEIGPQKGPRLPEAYRSSYQDDERAQAVQYVCAKTKENPFGTPRFAVCGAMTCVVTGAAPVTGETDEGYAALVYKANAGAGETVVIDKLVAVTTSRDLEEAALPAAAARLCEEARAKGYDALLEAHEARWAERWERADVTLGGDDAAQQGVRYNIFQLFSTYYGEDARLNIGPKGFTGEKYGGATYWDTEAYCLPLYMAIAGQDVARQLLKYRYLQLDGAYHNAAQQGLPGALYPMVTFTGVECHNEWEITFEEIHRNAAIAYAIFNYVTYTGDAAYLEEYGVDVLIGIARFWAGRVHHQKEKDVYMIHGVTGPNEYENNVNNNWYTNRMAAWCLTYAAQVARGVSEEKREKLSITEPELARFEEIAGKMYLPYDEARGVFVQHDTFLDKDLMPASDLPESERPINQHWSWDRILRSCFIKQADTLQGLYFLGHLYDKATKERNFHFYEPMCVHESSLSPCVHAILAAEIGDMDKAVEMYKRTSRLDLDNINNDTEDGLHITSMAGGWLAIVQGFAGMRTQTGRLCFDPVLPPCFTHYAFKIVYRGRLLEVSMDADGPKVARLSGDPLTVVLRGAETEI